ncbi:BamA/TamA family outer membrane protein [uncultured Ramlibacter sp.]|uniref:BamA/TamA family outer membrane protein n=1 Tax=uncultured Ramlibacter sp. TaxID=260755 RepID=UPI00261F740E|nr:BamA/TamA family outer membrane protein [uncultured Ramlibacter sp.]
MPVQAQSLLGERFTDPHDGAFDLSDWLLKRKGFLPVPIVITEPAVGYGAGMGMLFFRESLGEAAQKAKDSGRLAPPDILGGAAFATENGTWGGAGGGMVSFDADHYRWRGGVVRTNVNLDFYGQGGKLGPVGYTLDGWASTQHAMARLGESDAWLIGRWNYLDLNNRFDNEAGTGRLGSLERASKASGLGLSLEYDSRDNIFTPNRGWTGAIDLTFYDPDWGSDTRFQSYRSHVFSYWQLRKDLVLGGRADLRLANGKAPFFMLPSVDMRGVPAMRLQDTRTGVLEAELRWNVTPRWAVLGFAGGGRAWNSSSGFGDGTETFSRGVGFRYQLARLLGLWVGLDVAKSTQDHAFYIQVGNAWR